MTLARVRRPTCKARSAARNASPITYTPPWKYRTIWRGSIPSTVISAVGTPPSASAVTVTSAGSGCADSNSRSCRRCSSTSLLRGRLTAAGLRRGSLLFGAHGGSPFGWNSPGSTPGGLALVNPLLKIPCREAGHYQACRQAGEEASPDHGDSRDRSTAEPIFRGQRCVCWFRPHFPRPGLVRVPVTAPGQTVRSPRSAP